MPFEPDRIGTGVLLFGCKPSFPGRRPLEASTPSTSCPYPVRLLADPGLRHASQATVPHCLLSLSTPSGCGRRPRSVRAGHPVRAYRRTHRGIPRRLWPLYGYQLRAHPVVRDLPGGGAAVSRGNRMMGRPKKGARSSSLWTGKPCDRRHASAALSLSFLCLQTPLFP